MNKLILCLFASGWVALSWAQTPALNAGDYFGDMKARHIGPALMSGRISDVELHPKNSNIVLVGAAGGGVAVRLYAGVLWPVCAQS